MAILNHSVMTCPPGQGGAREQRQQNEQPTRVNTINATFYLVVKVADLVANALQQQAVPRTNTAALVLRRLARLESQLVYFALSPQQHKHTMVTSGPQSTEHTHGTRLKTHAHKPADCRRCAAGPADGRRLDEPVRRKLARRRQVRRVTVARAGVDGQNGVGFRVVGDDPAVGRRDVPHKLGGKTASAIAHKAHRVFGFFGHLMLARAWHGSAAIIKS